MQQLRAQQWVPWSDKACVLAPFGYPCLVLLYAMLQTLGVHTAVVLVVQFSWRILYPQGDDELFVHMHDVSPVAVTSALQRQSLYRQAEVVLACPVCSVSRCSQFHAQRKACASTSCAAVCLSASQYVLNHNSPCGR